VNTRTRIAGGLFAGVLCLSACGSDSKKAATTVKVTTTTARTTATTAKAGTATTVKPTTTTAKAGTATTVKPTTTTAKAGTATTVKPTTTTAKAGTATTGGATTTTVKAGTATTVKPTATTAKPAAGATTTSTAKLEEGVVAVGTTSLGNVLTNGAGETLYVSNKDKKGVSSACDATCAKTWIPDTVVSKATAGTGIDATKLSTITRSDGSKQVTYDGWPLYRYNDDTKAGDTKGEKVANEWYAVDAAGKTV
jgi:predicted lipoprotein with Yx(FWY)xxD motif